MFRSPFPNIQSLVFVCVLKECAVLLWSHISSHKPTLSENDIHKYEALRLFSPSSVPERSWLARGLTYSESCQLLSPTQLFETGRTRFDDMKVSKPGGGRKGGNRKDPYPEEVNARAVYIQGKGRDACTHNTVQADFSSIWESKQLASKTHLFSPKT